MEIVVYAPGAAVRAHPDVLKRLSLAHQLRAVVLRNEDPAAAELIRKEGVDVWWLAPGLWGNVTPTPSQRAQFLNTPHVRGLPAFESQWPGVYCPTNLDVHKGLVEQYIAVCARIGATGVYATHFRYHHPADIRQLWGCVCPRCVGYMQWLNLAPSDLNTFWEVLARRLEDQPVASWPEFTRETHPSHPLVSWWDAVTLTDIASRWFVWRGATIAGVIEMYANGLRDAGLFFTANSFDPIWAPLVGHVPGAVGLSAWYTPLLGYWATHVQQSAANLSRWHARLGNVKDVDLVSDAIASIVNADASLVEAAAALHHSLERGRWIAATVDRPYWPVVAGTSTAQPRVAQAFTWALECGAAGVVLQGVSQLLDDPTLDDWF